MDIPVYFLVVGPWDHGHIVDLGVGQHADLGPLDVRFELRSEVACEFPGFVPKLQVPWDQFLLYFVRMLPVLGVLLKTVFALLDSQVLDHSLEVFNFGGHCLDEIRLH